MPPGVLERDSRDPLFGWTAEGLRQALRARLEGRVEQAWIIGSFGTPAFGPGSDIDLILVTPTDVAFVDRAQRFGDLLDLVPSMDLLVYTPQELERLLAEPTAGFWCSVARTRRRLL